MTTATLSPAADSRREVKTLTIVAVVHLVSHFYWMMLVPLLPSLKELLNVSYVELGYALFFMNAVSAIIQAPTGFVVDRFGPRLCLVLGAAIGAIGHPRLRQVSDLALSEVGRALAQRARA